MDTLLLTFFAAIFFLGMFVIVLPFAMELYRRFNFRKVVTCPETRGLTEVKLDALWAAVTGIFGKPALRVKSCTLWPKKKGCEEACVRKNWPAG